MKHVNRLAVGGFTLTVGGVVFFYIPTDWLFGISIACVLLAGAYTIGAALLDR